MLFTYLALPPVRERQETASERPNMTDHLDLDDNVLKWECVLYRDEIRQSVRSEYPDMPETEQERLIQTTEQLIRQWIQRVKKRLSFEARARLCIAFAEYKRSHDKKPKALSDDQTPTDTYQRPEREPGGIP